MSPEQIQAFAQFLGVEPTAEAVYAALVELIAAVETSSAVATEGEMMEDGAEMQDEFRSVREALNLPDNSALIARLREYARSMEPEPARTLNLDALRSADEAHRALRATDTQSVTPNRPANLPPSTRSQGRQTPGSYRGFNINTGAGKKSLISETLRVAKLGIPGQPNAAKAGQNSATGVLGGHVVEQVIANELIEALIPELVLLRAGVRRMPMAGLASMSIPKASGRPTAYWVGQGRTIPTSNGTFEMNKLVPKKVATEIVIPNEMLATMTSAADAYLREHAALAIQEAVDLAGLYGRGSVTGSNPGDEPLGLFYTDGVVKTPLGVGNGAAPTVDDLIAQRTAIKQSNVRLRNFGHVMTPSIAGYFTAISDTTGQPNQRVVTRDQQVFIDGDPTYETTLVESNVTLGTSTDTGDIFTGEWSMLRMGLGMDLEMIVDPYSLSSQLSTKIIVITTADFVIDHTQAFRILTGVRNTNNA